MVRTEALRCMIKRISILGITILLLWPCYFFINYAIAAPPTIVMVENPYPEEGVHFGMGVSGISDINGDGVGDLVVGAPGADTVYLLSGSDRTLILAIEDPDGLVGYSFGHSVQAVGDINWDGIEDVAVGAPALGGGLSVPNPDCWNPESEWYDHPICDAPFGRAFVLSGATGELLVRFRYYRSLFGYAIAALGDVNGDWIPDVAVSSPFLWPNLGAVMAFSGADGSLLWERIEPEPDWGGNQPMASFGLFMTGVDDINADEYRDILVGAPFHSYGASASESIPGGKGFVLSGGDGTILRGHDNLTPSYNDYYGAGPAAIGDQNGDGVPDYMFSETRSGLVHVYSGSTGETIATITNPGGGNPDLFGFQSARAGDRDSDGVEDVWIAAPDDTFFHDDADGGVLYLMNGSNDVLFEISDPDTLVFEDSNGFGWRVAVTEDLNGDGVPDVMVGEPARSAEGQADAGVVYLVLGGFENGPPVADAGADSGDEEKPPCPIASVVYNNPQHPHVKILRDFRGKYLMPNKPGRMLVDLYYKYSPLITSIIAKHGVLKIAALIGLLPFVAFSYLMLNFGLILTVITLVSFSCFLYGMLKDLSGIVYWRGDYLIVKGSWGETCVPSRHGELGNIICIYIRTAQTFPP